MKLLQVILSVLLVSWMALKAADNIPINQYIVQQDGAKTEYVGLKLVTIGDSQTQFCQWQPWLQEWLGLSWSAEETTTGVDGHYPMAVGGTWVKPVSLNSISLRGRDAIYYNPDIIIIYAGQNDMLNSWKNNKNPYTAPLDVVQWEPVYSGTETSTDVSTISAFKGLVEYLKNELPNTRIYMMTHVPVLCCIGMDPIRDYADMYPSPRFATIQDVIDFEMSERYPKDDYIRAMAQYYNLPVIDQWKHSGITFDNTTQYYDVPSGDCTQVHLNAAGDKLIANCIAQYLLTGQYAYDPYWEPVDSLSNLLQHEQQTERIYNALGILQKDNNYHQLPKGIYIIGTQKIIINE